MSPLVQAWTESNTYDPTDPHNGFTLGGTTIGYSAGLQTPVEFILRTDAQDVNITVADTLVSDPAYYACARLAGTSTCLARIDFARGVTTLTAATPIPKGSIITIGIYLAYADTDGHTIAGATTGTVTISY